MISEAVSAAIGWVAKGTDALTPDLPGVPPAGAPQHACRERFNVAAVDLGPRLRRLRKFILSSIPTFSPWYEPTNDDVILGENISSVTVILDALTSFWKVTSPKNVEPLSIDLTTNPSSGVTDAVTEPLSILLWSNPSIASAGILNNPSPLPLKNPLPDGISILPIN